ncbi:restriction endonuclease [Enterovibrio sp. ZSDZ42]|uniref:Restriction endonuclease n=1 Tax=Enterovibrio gelatinilyticus TaxID=2899819 RepID=A0ABT5R7L4_9GAMM|nr:restriction endonuclease [Enterovibrio sp. ZSDZ42]MDD1796264.1 restriction endonuclease [Enterovibrio sp. ZSDZ42]
MNLPKYNEIMPYALAYFAENGAQKWRHAEVPLAKAMNVSDEDALLEYASGNGKVFPDRITWALSALAASNLLERPKRGVYQITELGRSFLSRPQDVHPYVKEKAEQRRLEKLRERSETLPELVNDSTDTTPSEALESAYQEILSERYDQILDTILSKTPRDFEHLVAKLLSKMGYGGQVENAVTVTKSSHDGGIDGVIKEDVLGFGRIYIQAKRYARDNSISREDIQRFVGALAVAQSNKGVFITTSRFTEHAKRYAQELNGSTNLVLIDGIQLAKYIYDYSLGMQTARVVEIKELDSDFWDDMENDGD